MLLVSELSEFVKHVSRLQIANSQDAGKRLFEALTMNSKVEGKDTPNYDNVVIQK